MTTTSTAVHDNTAGLSAAHTRILDFLETERPPTPCLVVDLDTVRRRFRAMRAAFPTATPFYAVKANPAIEVIDLLVAEGSAFDAAGVAEIDRCLSRGAAPETISYGNPIKKPRDIAHAYRRGVRTFVSDSAEDIRSIADHAPGSAVLVRIRTDPGRSAMPFGRKFGCSPDLAADLLRLAHRLGLQARGVAFHTGSQQLDPDAWNAPIGHAASAFTRLRTEGIELTTLNLGGGFPAHYREQPAPLSTFGRSIGATVTAHFGSHVPELMIEPGRSIVADAGLIRSEVVLVTRRDRAGGRRWVYLDIGRYSGLAETEGEAVAYRLRTGADHGPHGPVVIAGPTCDGDDVIYQHTPYRLPLALAAGDHVDLLCTGAYTSSYSSVEFNGFAPLPTYCL